MSTNPMSNERSLPFHIQVGRDSLEEADKWLPASSAEKLGMRARVLLPGLISYHEEHAVRVDAGYKLREWYELDYKTRVFEVAIRRIESMINRQVMEASKP